MLRFSAFNRKIAHVFVVQERLAAAFAVEDVYLVKLLAASDKVVLALQYDSVLAVIPKDLQTVQFF